MCIAPQKFKAILLDPIQNFIAYYFTSPLPKINSLANVFWVLQIFQYLERGEKKSPQNKKQQSMVSPVTECKLR